MPLPWPLQLARVARARQGRLRKRCSRYLPLPTICCPTPGRRTLQVNPYSMESTPTGEETLEAGPAAFREDDEMPQGRRRRRRRRIVVIANLVLGERRILTTTQGEQRRRLTPSLMTTSYVRRYTVGGLRQQGELADWGEDLRRAKARRASRRSRASPGATAPPGPRTTISRGWFH